MKHNSIQQRARPVDGWDVTEGMCSGMTSSGILGRLGQLHRDNSAGHTTAPWAVPVARDAHEHGMAAPRDFSSAWFLPLPPEGPQMHLNSGGGNRTSPSHSGHCSPPCSTQLAPLPGSYMRPRHAAVTPRQRRELGRLGGNIVHRLCDR